MGSDVSHFNVSLIVQGKVPRRCPSITIFEEKSEPKHGIGQHRQRVSTTILTRKNTSFSCAPDGVRTIGSLNLESDDLPIEPPCNVWSEGSLASAVRASVSKMAALVGELMNGLLSLAVLLAGEFGQERRKSGGGHQNQRH